jgi:hypothetical protein
MIERFWGIVHDELERYGLGLAEGCELDLQQFIASGVAKIRRTGGEASDKRVVKAEDQFRKFVRAMASEAKKQGYPELHEDTFAKARKLFCPGFWPFC